MRTSKWVNADTGRFLAAAFLRRPGEAGLSVGRTFDSAVAGLNRIYGCATLHCGGLRGIGLSPVHEPTVENPDHAEILGMPHPDDDPQAAQDYALKLAAQARYVARSPD